MISVGQALSSYAARRSGRPQADAGRDPPRRLGQGRLVRHAGDDSRSPSCGRRWPPSGPPDDVMIAAIALANDFTLVTRRPAELRPLPPPPRRVLGLAPSRDVVRWGDDQGHPVHRPRRRGGRLGVRRRQHRPLLGDQHGGRRIGCRIGRAGVRRGRARARQRHRRPARRRRERLLRQPGPPDHDPAPHRLLHLRHLRQHGHAGPGRHALLRGAGGRRQARHRSALRGQGRRRRLPPPDLSGRVRPRGRDLPAHARRPLGLRVGHRPAPALRRDADGGHAPRPRAQARRAAREGHRRPVHRRGPELQRQRDVLGLRLHREHRGLRAERHLLRPGGQLLRPRRAGRARPICVDTAATVAPPSARSPRPG